MKSSLITLLAVVVTLVFSCTAFASNPFIDVPRDHWSYNAVSKLAADGIIDGETAGTFNGDRTLTRYEFAQIIARAMAQQDKANAEEKALIKKLSVEYKTEIEGLGVRVAALETKTSKIDIEGSAYFRYNSKYPYGYYQADQHSTYDGDAVDELRSANIDLKYTYHVSEGWVIKMESEYKRLLDTTTNSLNTLTGVDPDMNTLAEQLYTSGPMGIGQFVYGRHSYAPGYGLTYAEKTSGGQYTIGDKIKTTFNWGHTTYQRAEIRAVEVVAAVNKNTNIRANYESIEDITSPGRDNRYGIGADIALNKNLVFKAAAAEADLIGYTDKVRGYLAGLQYNVANKDVEQSGDIFVTYSKIPYDLAYNQLPDIDDFRVAFQGTRVGFDYVPLRNIVFTAWYMTGNQLANSFTKSASLPKDLRVFRAQVQMYF